MISVSNFSKPQPPASAGFLFILIFDKVYGGDLIFRNVGLSPNYTALTLIRFRQNLIPCKGKKNEKVKLSLCLTNYAVRHENVWGSEDTHFSLPRYYMEVSEWSASRPGQVKSPRYPLDMRSGGSQSRSGRRGEQKILDRTGTRTRPLVRPARNQSLYRLRNIRYRTVMYMKVQKNM
jgi:hypothetical protein